MLANGGRDITLILLTWTIWRAPTNASKWRMGFNSAFKGLNRRLLGIREIPNPNIGPKTGYHSRSSLDFSHLLQLVFIPVLGHDLFFRHNFQLFVLLL
jgi:hypothetical protein